MSVQRIENIKLITLGAALGFWFVFYAWGTAEADVPAAILSIAWIGLAGWQRLAGRALACSESA